MVDAFSSHHSRANVAALLESGRRLLPELPIAPFDLAAVACPVLLVWGTRDRMVPHSGARVVLDALPETRVELIEDCGHCPQLEATGRCSSCCSASRRSLRRDPARDGRSANLHGRRSAAASPTCAGCPPSDRQRPAAHPLALRRRAPRAAPVLLVPPLAAPAICFDLRRGCSLAEHLVHAGRRTYLLEYGDIQFADRDLGLEHWIEDVIPAASARAARTPARPCGSSAGAWAGS